MVDLSRVSPGEWQHNHFTGWRIGGDLAEALLCAPPTLFPPREHWGAHMKVCTHVFAHRVMWTSLFSFKLTTLANYMNLTRTSHLGLVGAYMFFLILVAAIPY